jgi:hypothetical protein
MVQKSHEAMGRRRA